MHHIFIPFVVVLYPYVLIYVACPDCIKLSNEAIWTMIWVILDLNQSRPVKQQNVMSNKKTHYRRSWLSLDVACFAKDILCLISRKNF